MTNILTAGLIFIPSFFVLAQQTNPQTVDNLTPIREVATFVVSVLLAWAVKYIRESRAEVLAAKEQLPTKTETKNIADDVVVIKADLAVMTDSLERTRKERDEAVELLKKSNSALEKTNELLAAEREVNSNWGRISKENDDKIQALTAEVNMLKEVDIRMERLADRIMERVLQIRGQVPGEEAQ